MIVIEVANGERQRFAEESKGKEGNVVAFCCFPPLVELFAHFQQGRIVSSVYFQNPNGVVVGPSRNPGIHLFYGSVVPWKAIGKEIGDVFASLKALPNRGASLEKRLRWLSETHGP